MDWRVKRINDEIQKHDHLLFVKIDPMDGMRHVMRKHTKAKRYDLGDGQTVTAYESSPEYIMSLTDNWSMRGKSVDWGLECISKHLRDIDSWNPNSLANTMLDHNAKVDESKKRKQDNLMEDMAREYLPIIKENFKYTNTSQMDMKKDPRRKGDRKYGNRK